MIDYSISIKPFGSKAMLVEWPNHVDEDILKDILNFSNFLKGNYLKENEWDIIPAYNSLTLINRNDDINRDEFIAKLQNWYASKKEAESVQRHLWKLPVCYDLEFGIDLLEVEDKLNLSVAEIIQEHTKHQYTVFGIGFLPGFMYLGGLPKQLEIPRRTSPRLTVKKGAVGLAGKQTGVYPQNSPGGWNIIGNCLVPLFSPQKKEPCFVNVGDKVQFYAIEKAEYELRKIEIDVGIYNLEKIKIDA